MSLQRRVTCEPNFVRHSREILPAGQAMLEPERDRGFESISLQQRVCEPPVPLPAQAVRERALIASGLIASLAVPGGNITGERHLVPELDAKTAVALARLPGASS
jgi:hypothetical protein